MSKNNFYTNILGDNLEKRKTFMIELLKKSKEWITLIPPLTSPRQQEKIKNIPNVIDKIISLHQSLPPDCGFVNWGEFCSLQTELPTIENAHRRFNRLGAKTAPIWASVELPGICCHSTAHRGDTLADVIMLAVPHLSDFELDEIYKSI